MKPGPPGHSARSSKALREAAGYTQEELATIVGLSVYGISALERGERRRQWARAYAARRTMSIDALLKDIEGVVQKE